MKLHVRSSLIGTRFTGSSVGKDRASSCIGWLFPVSDRSSHERPRCIVLHLGPRFKDYIVLKFTTLSGYPCREPRCLSWANEIHRTFRLEPTLPCSGKPASVTIFSRGQYSLPVASLFFTKPIRSTWELEITAFWGNWAGATAVNTS